MTPLARCLALALLAAPASAVADNRMEVGGFAGAHLYNDDNELGVVDLADAPSLAHGVAFGVRVAFAFVPMLAAEGELAVVPTTVRDSEVDVLNLNWRLHGVVQLGGGRLRPFALLGVGGSTSQSSDPDLLDNDTDLVGQLGVGAKLRGGRDWGVRFDARALLVPSSAGPGPTTDWELTVGLYRTFGAPAAPAAPAPPVAAAPADDDPDGDHIRGADDLCPDQPENVNGFEDDDGCPDVHPDRDGDGIADAVDRCPDDLEDVDGFEDDDGCPDPDNDADGVADAVDLCPTELETHNGWQDDDGCPDELPAKVAALAGPITGVSFAAGKDTLTPAARRAIDQVAAVLREFPALRLEISGHTDDRGEPEALVDLSRRRAEAVKGQLVASGISPDRLTVVGRGLEQPAADNATAKGRRANQRIELRVIPAAETSP
jgi:OmpA-OmpF porin, OOP family